MELSGIFLEGNQVEMPIWKLIYYERTKISIQIVWIAKYQTIFWEIDGPYKYMEFLWLTSYSQEIEIYLYQKYDRD